MVELGSHLTEARLWTLSFPGEAEEVAFPLAQDDAANLYDRGLGIYIVGVLARAGNTRAEKLLGALSQSDSENIAAEAASTLARGDLQGRYLELYCRRARGGDLAALMLLGDWVDPRSKEVLQDIVSNGTSTEQGLARKSLRRISWLEASNWAHRIETILASTRGEDSMECDWALRVARNRSLPGLTGILRKRLQEAEAEHVELCKIAYNEPDACIPLPAHERDFIGSQFLVSSVDWNFDEVLQAFAELGGELTPLEHQRLYALGYGNDPRKRLFEFVSDWK
jgi:hypothetical protein